MKNEKVTNYLNYYKSLSNPQYAVLLKGGWGCGKTFYIKNQIDSWGKKEKIDEKEIFIKPIYVSLNGLSKISQINEKIKSILNPLLYSKSAKYLKGLLLGALKATTRISFDTNKDGDSDGNISFDIDPLGLLKSSDTKIKGNKILIFDDLERCNIELNEVFGYINDFIEHSECKVIIIADEKKLVEKYNNSTYKLKFEYKDIKEKLVGQVFTVEPDIEKALSFFIGQTKIKKLLEENKAVLIDIFLASKIKNLRILKQAILDFERFKNQIDKKFKEQKKFSEFIKYLLACFLLVYLEHKNGNENIRLLQEVPFNDSEKDIAKKLKKKYYSVLLQHHLNFYLRNVISINSIIYFIENGFNDTLTLNKELSRNYFFNEKTIQPWEKLRDWRYLEDEEFEKIYPAFYENFKQNKYKDPLIILHIVGILIDMKLYKIIDVELSEVVDIAKKGIDIAFKTKNLKFSSTQFDHYLCKGYCSKQDKKFIEVKNYIHEKIKSYSFESKVNYMKKIFENFSEDKILKLHTILEEALPDGRLYKSTAIFEKINGEKMGECFLNLTKTGQQNFMYFIQNRYESDYILNKEKLECHSKDIQCLEEFKNYLKSKVKNRKPIAKFYTNKHIEVLSGIIENIKK